MFSLNVEKYKVCLRSNITLFIEYKKTPDPAVGEIFYKKLLQNRIHILRITFLFSYLQVNCV